jgi:hypothetical protein
MNYPFIAVWIDDQSKISAEDIIDNKAMYYDILRHMTYYSSDDDSEGREIFNDFYSDVKHELSIELVRLISYGILECDRINDGTVNVILKYLCLHRRDLLLTPILESDLIDINHCNITVVNLYKCSSQLITFLSRKIVDPKMFDKGV